MTDRVKENKKMLDRIPQITEGLSYQQADLQCKCWIVSLLTDISTSLAVIADKLPENPDERALRDLELFNEKNKNEKPYERAVDLGPQTTDLY